MQVDAVQPGLLLRVRGHVQHVHRALRVQLDREQTVRLGGRARCAGRWVPRWRLNHLGLSKIQTDRELSGAVLEEMEQCVREHDPSCGHGLARWRVHAGIEAVDLRRWHVIGRLARTPQRERAARSLENRRRHQHLAGHGLGRGRHGRIFDSHLARHETAESDQGVVDWERPFAQRGRHSFGLVLPAGIQRDDRLTQEPAVARHGVAHERDHDVALAGQHRHEERIVPARLLHVLALASRELEHERPERLLEHAHIAVERHEIAVVAEQLQARGHEHAELGRSAQRAAHTRQAASRQHTPHVPLHDSDCLLLLLTEDIFSVRAGEIGGRSLDCARLIATCNGVPGVGLLHRAPRLDRLLVEGWCAGHVGRVHLRLSLLLCVDVRVLDGRGAALGVHGQRSHGLRSLHDRSFFARPASTTGT